MLKPKQQKYINHDLIDKIREKLACKTINFKHTNTNTHIYTQIHIFFRIINFYLYIERGTISLLMYRNCRGININAKSLKRGQITVKEIYLIFLKHKI